MMIAVPIFSCFLFCRPGTQWLYARLYGRLVVKFLRPTWQRILLVTRIARLGLHCPCAARAHADGEARRQARNERASFTWLGVKRDAL